MTSPVLGRPENTDRTEHRIVSQNSVSCQQNGTSPTYVKQYHHEHFTNNRDSLPTLCPNMSGNTLLHSNANEFLNVDDHCYMSIAEVHATVIKPTQIGSGGGGRESGTGGGRDSGTGTLQRQKAPAPPKRKESTKLSSHVDLPQTRYFIREMDRVISQKHDQGVGGLANLEVPLPPPPPLVLDDRTCVDFGDLPPPPPADLLAGLKPIRRNGPKVPPKRK